MLQMKKIHLKSKLGETSAGENLEQTLGRISLTPSLPRLVRNGRSKSESDVEKMATEPLAKHQLVVDGSIQFDYGCGLEWKHKWGSNR